MGIYDTILWSKSFADGDKNTILYINSFFIYNLNILYLIRRKGCYIEQLQWCNKIQIKFGGFYEKNSNAVL